MRIALLEDEPLVAEYMRTLLVSAGRSCETMATAADFVCTLGRDTFDLLVLDWLLPDGNGVAGLSALGA